jgi:hypothetical protein
VNYDPVAPPADWLWVHVYQPCLMGSGDGTLPAVCGKWVGPVRLTTAPEDATCPACRRALLVRDLEAIAKG